MFARRLQQTLGRSRLDRIVARIQKAGAKKPYDCVIGVSGGVDSSVTALLRLARAHGARVLRGAEVTAIERSGSGWDGSRTPDIMAGWASSRRI